MTLLEYHKAGILKELFDKGIISVNHYTYIRYFQVWEAYRKQGYSKNKSYLYASDECGACVSTIRKAVRVVNS